MGYTHHDKVSANSFAIGQKGSEIDLNVDQDILNAIIEDVSTADKTYVVAPYACTFEKAYSVLQGPITTAGAATINFYVGSTAATAVTGGALTIAATSSEGDVDVNAPTAENTLTAGQALVALSDGGSTTDTSGGDTTSPARLSIILKRV